MGGAQLESDAFNADKDVGSEVNTVPCFEVRIRRLARVYNRIPSSTLRVHVLI